MSKLMNFRFGEGSEVPQNDEDEEGTSMLRRSSKSNRFVCYWAILTTVVMICLIITVAVIANKPPPIASNNSETSGKATSSNSSSMKNITWCTVSPVEQKKCKKMSSNFARAMMSPLVKCMQKSNASDCVKALKNKEADVFTTDGGYLYKNMTVLKPIMAEDYGYGDASYWAVAVVKKSDSSTNLTSAGLMGKATCHTGYQKSAGWNMPMGMLLKLGILDANSCGDEILQGVKNIFRNNTCAPGGPCEVCGGCSKSSSCDKELCKDDKFKGYTGAFRCLVESGNVAFIKHTTVFENTDGNNQGSWAQQLSSNDFELLCPGGSRAPLGRYESCNLGKVPAHAVVVSAKASDETVESIQSLLLVAQFKFGRDSNFKLFGPYSNTNDLLFKSSTQKLLPLDKSCTTQHFLGVDYINKLNGLSCKEPITPQLGSRCLLAQYATQFPTSLRWCVVSDNEMRKCQQLAKIALENNAALPILCVQGKDADTCASMVGEGTADLVNLDGGHIYQAGFNYNLQVLAAESYGTESTGSVSPSYYAVAVIKASDVTTNLTKLGLQGKKTCHTGYKKNAGWNVPIGYLASKGIITAGSKCNYAAQVATFFKGSCVPGVNNKTYPKLCSICGGNSSTLCKANQDPYRGYGGALKCLSEGKGDIAFVNQNTVLEAVNSTSNYKLLCQNGSTVPPSSYLECNLQQVPSHALLTSSKRSSMYKEIMWTVLNSLQNAENSILFNSTSFGDSDLMFEDKTKCLRKASGECSWQNYLGRNYVSMTSNLYCQNVTALAFGQQCNFLQCKAKDDQVPASA